MMPCVKIQFVSARAFLTLLALAGVLTAWGLQPIQADSCNSLEKPLTQAMLALRQGRLAEADRLLASLQSSRPECHELALATGRLRMAQGDDISAQRLFSLYTLQEPQDARGHYFLSSLLFSQRNYARAEKVLSQALSLNPDDPDSLTLRGQLLLMKGQIVPAEEALAKACRLAPENAASHFELGKLYDSQHKSPQAVTFFEIVITLSPKDPRAYDYLALNLDRLGNAERAEWAFQKGLEANKGPLKDGFLNYNYGRFLVAHNRLAEARLHLDQAVSLAPRTRAVYYERAKLSMRLKNYADARGDAERALNLADSAGFVLDLQVYAQLATIYSRLGEKELAAKYAKISKDTPVPLDGYKTIR